MTTPTNTPETLVLPKTPEPTLCSSQFKMRVYQDLGKDTKPLELPILTDAIFAYEIDDGSDTFSDDYFPEQNWDDDEDDEDGDSEWPVDVDDDDEVDEDECYEVTVSYCVTASVLKEIKGAFPLPADANLVFEITHLDPNGTPVYKHVFRGWPHHNCSHSASLREPSEMVHTIALQCEETLMFQMPV